VKNAIAGESRESRAGIGLASNNAERLGITAIARAGDSACYLIEKTGPD
jgi:hypothetical protein